MTVTDKLGNEIEIGSYIIYSNTATIGEVLETRVDENGSWVLVALDELSKLWYNTMYVEVTDQKYAKTVKDSDNDDKELTVDDIKEQLSNSVSSEMSGDAVGGG